jgi:hypothetical protein
MPGTKSMHSYHGTRMRQKRMRELRLGLILGLICSGLAAAGIYLLHWMPRF